MGLSKGAKVVVDKTEFVVKELTQDLMTVVATAAPNTSKQLNLGDMAKVEVVEPEAKKKKGRRSTR